MIASIHAKIWIEMIPNAAKWQMTDETVTENAYSRLRQPNWTKRHALKSDNDEFYALSIRYNSGVSEWKSIFNRSSYACVNVIVIKCMKHHIGGG